jgi:uncharacterized protein (TIGR02266 family)
MTTSSRRSQPRVEANLTVKLRVPAGETTATNRIRNISLGGVFIEMDEPIAFGTEVQLEFSLPVAPRVIRCKGFVVWSTKTSPERVKDGVQGIGVRLMEIGIADMRTLAEYIEHELAV